VRPETEWDDRNFVWSNYAPRVRMAIAKVRESSRRLMRCSLCGKRRVRHGVLLPPALRQVEAPPGVRPLAYAVCRQHSDLSLEELGDLLLPGWRQHDVP
jgi:hypothetical protein